MKKVVGIFVVFTGLSVVAWYVFVKKKPVDKELMISDIEKEIAEVDTGTGLILRNSTRASEIAPTSITRSTGVTRRL